MRCRLHALAYLLLLMYPFPDGEPAGSTSSGYLIAARRVTTFGDVRPHTLSPGWSTAADNERLRNSTSWSTSMLSDLTASEIVPTLPSVAWQLRPSRRIGEFVSAIVRRMTSGRASDTTADDHRLILQVVQPALAGMMGGSVSTLALLFATALATRDAHTTFLVGLAAAVGAGISMAFAEALSDDGSLTGRGNPISEAVSTNSGSTAATSLPIFDPVRPLRAPGAAFARVPM